MISTNDHAYKILCIANLGTKETSSLDAASNLGTKETSNLDAASHAANLGTKETSNLNAVKGKSV